MTSRSRAAAATRASNLPSTSGPRRRPATRTVWAWRASTRLLSRFGSTWSILVSARRAVSSIPSTDPPLAVLSETAIATASSSSSSSGGIAAPAESR